MTQHRAVTPEVEETLDRLADRLETTMTFVEACRYHAAVVDHDADELANAAWRLFGKAVAAAHAEQTRG